MITAACFLPHPPLLLAEYASLADPGGKVRERCRTALTEFAGEKFEADGRPSGEDSTRVRVQARQIFVFSHAAAAGAPAP